MSQDERIAKAPRAGGRFRSRGPDRDFDPRPLRGSLLPLLRAIAALPGDSGATLAAEVLDPLLRRHPRPGGGFFSRSELIAGLRVFARRGRSGVRSVRLRGGSSGGRCAARAGSPR